MAAPVRPRTTPQPGATSQPDTESAQRTAVAILRLLARLPASPWKATCLYRAIAVCLLLRWSGVAAILRIGAASTASAASTAAATAQAHAHSRDSDLTAHAWVENAAGDVLYEKRGAYVALK
jgi:hypothetical protein